MFVRFNQVLILLGRNPFRAGAKFPASDSM
jgi:hypothetical protein